MNWKTRGYIYSVPAKLLCQRRCPNGRAAQEELKHRFRELAAELRYLGTSQQELMELLKEGKESSHD